MSFPTVSAVILRASQVHLGDGQSLFYTSSRLLPAAVEAINIMHEALATVGGAAIIGRTKYLKLPAYQESIFLNATATGNVPDLRSIENVSSRLNVTEYTISAIDTTLKRITTSAAHGREIGDLVTVDATETTAGAMSISDGAYQVTAVPSSTVIEVSSYAGSGTYGTGGVLRHSATGFYQLKRTNGMLTNTVTTATDGGYYMLKGNRIMFQPFSSVREIKLDYNAMGITATSGSDVVQVPGCITALGLLTAALATQSRKPDLSRSLMVKAVGPAWPDAIGGALYQLVNAYVKSNQGADVGENSFDYDTYGRVTTLLPRFE